MAVEQRWAWIRWPAYDTDTPGLVVHPMVTAAGPSAEHLPKWTVTHEPSGFRIGTLPHELAARTVAQRLGKTNWNMSEEELKAQPNWDAITRAVRKLLREFEADKA